MQIIEDGTDNASIDLESAAGIISSLFTSSTDGNTYLVGDATKCLVLSADENNNPLGKVGIGKNNPACAFDVHGDAQIGGNITIGSSISVGGNMTIGGNVTVVGSLTSASSSQNNQYFSVGANYTGTASSTSGAFLTVNSATFTDIASTTGASYANFYANYIGAPSLATTATGVVATNASTLYISGAPTVSGTNDSILNAYSLNVNSGSSLFNAPVIVSNTNNLGSTNNIPTETTGALVVKGDVQLYGTKGALFFNQGMAGGSPTFTTRSIGSRIVLYPQVASNSADHAIGVSSASSWYSSPTTLHYHRFYCGTTDVFDIVGSGAYLNTGNLYIQSASLSTVSGNDIYVNANASTVHLRPTAGSTNCELSVSTGNLTYNSTSGSTLLNIAANGSGATLSSPLSISNTLDSTSATSAASLGVSGGVSVAKSVFIASNLNVGANTTIGGNANISGNAIVSNNMTVGAMNVVNNLATANLTTVNTTVSGNALVGGNAVISNNATIGGGALIGGNTSIAGSASILNTTDSTSATSAASLGVSGGVSVAKSVFVGTNLNLGSNLNVGTNTTIGGNALIGGNTNILGSLSVTSFSSPSNLLINSSLSGTPSNGQHISILNSSFLDTVTPTSGTLASWSDVYFGQPTLNATRTSVTTTTASTLYIAGAPLAGTNETITNAYSLNIGSGNSLFGGNLEVVNTLKVDNTTDVSATGNGAVQVSGGVNVSKGLYLGYGLSSFSQDTGASTGWYILGLFTAGNAGSSRLKLELLGVSGYTANATAGGSTTLFMSVNSSTSTSGSTANCNGSYFCLGGTACVSSIKFVQNGSNRSSYYIYANLTTNSLHSVNATYRSGDSFVQQFTSTTDPGANSATVQQASNLMSVSSGLLGVGKSAGSSLAVGTGTGSRVLDLADSGATGRIRLTNSTATAALELIYNTTTSYIMTSGTDSRTYAYNGAGNALILQANEANTTIGSVGICKNNPSYPLDVAGNAHFGNNIYTDGVFSSTNTTALANTMNGLGPTLGAMVVAGDLLMQGSITGQIVWDQAKSGAFPTTTTRSAGTRLNLYPNLTSTQVDHAIGVGPSTMWLSVPDNNHWISFYTGTQETVDIYGNGLMVGTTYILENTSNTMNYTSGALVVMGDIQLYGSLGSLIFDQNKSVGTPTTTTRSVGSRIVLYPNVDATHCEHAMGIANNMSWYGVPTTSHYHKFYCGTSDVLDITGASVTVNTALNVTGDVGGAITTFATVVSQGTTVFSGTSSSMSYWTMGKLAFFWIRFSYTGASSVQSAQKCQFTLPFTTAAFATAVNIPAISYRSTADCFVGITGSSAIATLYVLGTNATGGAYSAFTGGDMVVCQGLIKTA